MKLLTPFIISFILLFSFIPFSASASVTVPTDISYSNSSDRYPSISISSDSFFPNFSTIQNHYSLSSSSPYIQYNFYSLHSSNDNLYWIYSFYFYFPDSASISFSESSGIYLITCDSSCYYYRTYRSFDITSGSLSDISYSSRSTFYRLIYDTNTNNLYYYYSGQWWSFKGVFSSFYYQNFDFSIGSETSTSTSLSLSTSETTTTTITKDYVEEQLNVSNSILDNVKSLLSSIINLPSKIAESIQGFFITLGNTIIEKLEYLFIPSGDNLFSDVKDIISEKFGIFNQLFDLAGVIIHYDYSDAPPDFNITLYGHTVTIVDWELFSKYRLFIHGIIIFIAYYFFIKRLIKRIPQIIRGI